MSIIERSSPLNLAYRVVIVTNASSPVGVIVSNTLLKANALVLGVDRKEKDSSLTTSTYTHFQFYSCNLADGTAIDETIAYAKQIFKVERIDALVNLTSADDDADTHAAHKRLAVACAAAMEADGGGVIVNSAVQAADVKFEASETIHRLVNAVRDINSTVSSEKLRCNMIAPGQCPAPPPTRFATNAEANTFSINAVGDEEDLKPCQQYEDAKDHFLFLFNTPGLVDVQLSQNTFSMLVKLRGSNPAADFAHK